MEAASRIELENNGFAGRCLTTWPSRLKWSGKRELNPRLRPWQGRTLPLSYSRSLNFPASGNKLNSRLLKTSASVWPAGFLSHISRGSVKPHSPDSESKLPPKPIFPGVFQRIVTTYAIQNILCFIAFLCKQETTATLWTQFLDFSFVPISNLPFS